LACQDINRRKHRCHFVFRHRLVRLQPFYRLVSLTRDFSVFIDLSGDEIFVNVLANGYYMHFALFVKGYQTIYPGNLRFHFYAYRSFADLHVRQQYSLFIEHASGRYYMRFTFFVKENQAINLKKCIFVFMHEDYYLTFSRLVVLKHKIISQHVLNNCQCCL